MTKSLETENTNYRRLWLPELIVFLVLSVLTYFIFKDAQWDLFFAELFYTPQKDDVWSHQNDPLWTFFYHGAPVLTGVLLFGSLIVLALSQLSPKWASRRIYALFVFLAVLIGPGVLVNSIFKPYWGRPRPRQVQELGGKYEFKAWHQPGIGAQGMSFPCGHSSVGYAFGVFFWVYRRKNPVVAHSWMLGSIALGTVMGVGRIAAGGHFMSDVIWSALMVWFPAWWLYYFGLRIPEREDGLLTKKSKAEQKLGILFDKKWFKVAFYGGLSVATILSLLLASPFYKALEYNSGSQSVPKSIVLELGPGDVSVNFDTQATEALKVSGYIKGFGFPTNEVWIEEEATAEQISVRLKRSGFFSDFENHLVLRLNPQFFESIQLKNSEGEFVISGEVPSEKLSVESRGN